MNRLRESEQLFADTIEANEEAVAAQIEKVHSEETVALHYNKEDSLRLPAKSGFRLAGAGKEMVINVLRLQ